MHCPRCNFENANAVTYCEHCGAYLQTSTPYTQPQVDFTPPTPSPMEYSAIPSQSYGMQSEIFSNQRIFPSSPRITVFRVIRSILYFIATLIVILGILGVTVAWFMAVILAFALGANPDLSLGLIFLLYGFVLAAASLW